MWGGLKVKVFPFSTFSVCSELDVQTVISAALELSKFSLVISVIEYVESISEFQVFGLYDIRRSKCPLLAPLASKDFNKLPDDFNRLMKISHFLTIF